MHFKKIFTSIVQWILFPIAILYGFVIKLRHFLYNKNILKSLSFDLPIFCVGNLSVGGTGKSPMVLYLTNLLAKQNLKVAIISRGYKRKTKGVIWATNKSTANDIGDEPLMFFKEVQQFASVIVSEKRVEGVQSVIKNISSINAIVLDDAMQHRPINPSFTILLTQFNNVYINDFLIPTGTLRDVKQRASIADVVVVTKCDDKLTIPQMENVLKQMPPSKKIFFTSIAYGTLYGLYNNEIYKFLPNTNVILITGIANPHTVQQYVQSVFNNVILKEYNDHYTFTINDVLQWQHTFSKIKEQNKIIITTQKDAMRLLPFKKELQLLPIYVLPISIHFLFEGQAEFDNIILQHIQNF